MPLVDNNGIALMPFGHEEVERDPLGFFDVLGDAVVQENPAVSLAISLSRPYHPPQAGFDLPARLKTSKYFLSHPRAFVGVESDAEFDSIEAQLQEEEQRRARLAAAGGWGIAAMMTAGMLSPTVFLPLVGAGKTGLSALKSAAAWGALGAVIDEGVLAATQRTRSGDEVMLGFTTQFLLSTLLGVSVASLRPRMAQDVEDYVNGLPSEASIHPSNPNIAPGDLPEEFRMGVGAQAVGGESGQRLQRIGGKLGPGGFFRYLGGPVIRLAESSNPVFRRAGNLLESGGLFYERNIEGIAQAEGGTAAARAKARHAVGFEVSHEIDLAYSRYALGASDVITRNRAFLQSTARLQPSGKMTLEEFRTEVGRALHTGDESEVPEIKALIPEIRKALDERAEELLELEFVKEAQLDSNALRGEGFLSYLFRMWNKDVIKARSDDFLRMLEANFERQLQEKFKARFDKLQEKLRLTQEEASDLSVEADVRREMLEDFRKQKERLEEEHPGADFAARADTMRSLAREAKKEGRVEDHRQMLEVAREIEKEGAEIFKEFKGKRREINRRMRNLSRAVVVMEEKHAKALASIDRMEEIGINALRSFAKRAHQTLKKLDKLTDAQLDKELHKLRDLAEKAFAALDRAEARLDSAAKKVPLEHETPIIRMTPAQEKVLAKAFPDGWPLAPHPTRTKRHEYVLANEADRQRLLEKMDAAMEEASPQMRTSLRQLAVQIQEAAIPDADELAAAGSRMERAEAGISRAETRVDKRVDDLAEAEDLDRVAVRAELEDIITQTAEKVQRAQHARFRRIDNAIARAEKMSPERAVARVKALNEAIPRLKAEFADRYRSIADDTGDVLSGDVTFKGLARDNAQALYDKMLGISDRPPGWELLTDPNPDLRGSELSRGLDVPFEEAQEFLTLDVEKVLRAYFRTTSSDISLAEKLGDATGTKMLAEANNARHIQIERVRGDDRLSPEQKNKKIKKINEEYEDNKNDVLAMIARLRHLRGIPEDPEGLGYRLGKASMDLQTLRLMGMVVPSSVADSGKVVFKHGVMRSFGTSFKLMIEGFKGIRASSRELQLAGTANDLVASTRAQMVSDIWDTVAGRTVPERMLNYAATHMGRVALFDFWNFGIKNFAGVISNGRISEGIEKLMNGTAKPKELRYLAQLGIGEPSARRIWAQLQKPDGANRVGGYLLPNTKHWDDPEAIRAWRAAVAEDVDNTIVTPGLERPLFADQNIGWRLITQFRSFGYSSLTKTLYSGLQQADLAALNGMLAMLAGGALSYYIYGMTVGGEAKQRMLNADADKWLDEAIDRSGLLARFSMWRDALDRFPATSPYVSFSDQGLTRRSGIHTAGMFLGPSFGGFMNAMSIGAGLDDPTQSTVNSAKRLWPYHNVFYARWLFDQIAEDAGSNLPERRERQ